MRLGRKTCGISIETDERHNPTLSLTHEYIAEGQNGPFFPQP